MAVWSHKERLPTFTPFFERHADAPINPFDHNFREFSQVRQAFHRLLLETQSPLTVENHELTHLADTDIGFFTTFAGVGHNRVCTDVAAALNLDEETSALRWKIEVNGTLAGKTHHQGSNNETIKKLIEFVQTHRGVQRLTAWPFNRTKLRHDSPPVLWAVDEFLKHSQQEKAMLVAFHPDVAYVLSYYKKELEQLYDKDISLVVVMTDHLHKRPQYVWNLTMADAIITPDSRSADLTQKELPEWNKLFRNNGRVKQLPIVKHIPYPVNPYLAAEPSPEKIHQRKERLAPKSTDTRVLVPLGGSAPQQEYLFELITSLPPDFSVTVLLKSNDSTKPFEAKLEQAGITTIAVQTSEELLTTFVEQVTNGIDLVITKPSELSALTQLPKGPLVLFTSPVQDQEVQNLSFKQLQGVIPDTTTQQRMHRASPDELAAYATLAMQWRGLKLPDGKKPDPKAAAQCIVAAKRAGIFESMMNYTPKEGEGISCLGAKNFWHELNDIAQQLQEKKYQVQ